jgi:hypothetical protein
VDGHRGSTTAAVAELRLRLYRPDPPADAVAVYLAALRREPAAPAVGPAVASPVAPHGRVLAALGVAAAALVAVVVAVQVGRQVPELVAAPTVQEAPTSTSTSSPASGPLPAPPLMGTPLGDLSGTGPATGRFTADGHRVVASVLCAGVGTLSVRIGTAPPTLLSCVEGPPALAIVAGTGPLDRFTIAVRTDAPIRWSLAAAATDR